MHPWNQPILDALGRRGERLPHALLLHGVRGVGKLALAERMAQGLLCESADRARRPCGACDACRWFLAGNHPDFRRLEPEALSKQEGAEEEGTETPKRTKKPSTEIKVDQVRELADFLYVGSHRGGLRVALVYPAEDMNPNAANALLKGLEEPPAGAMFLLVSHSPARLLPTVRSRCVAIPVPVPPREAALKWLSGQGVKDAERWLAYAGGAPLRALDYAADAATWERLISSPTPVEDRDGLLRLAEALQKVALDQALLASGLPAKYRTARGNKSGSTRAWLAYARQIGNDRLLAEHPVNPKLFSSEMISSKPKG
jgi:DNA polymerase III subunit delta'